MIGSRRQRDSVIAKSIGNIHGVYQHTSGLHLFDLGFGVAAGSQVELVGLAGKLGNTRQGEAVCRRYFDHHFQPCKIIFEVRASEAYLVIVPRLLFGIYLVPIPVLLCERERIENSEFQECGAV